MEAKELIAQVRRIEIRTQKAVDELVCGAYHSRFKGRGMEFDEVREYVAGDDVRDIDWNVTARMGVPFIKQYVEERELHVLLAVDVSNSGLFGSTEKTKIRTQAEMAALLALSAIRNHDKVGMVTFSDHIESHLPMRSGRGHVLRLIRDLVASDPQNAQTDIGALCLHLYQILNKRTVIFILSDMIDSLEKWSKPLRMLAKKHDVIIAHVQDPVDQNWKPSGFWNLTDSETHEHTTLWATRAFKHNYAHDYHTHHALLTHEIRKAHAGYVPILCGDDIVKPLMHYFGTKRRRT